jgi:hypothetical protein
MDQRHGAATGRKVDVTTLELQTLAVYRTGLEASGIEIIRALDLRNAVTRSGSSFFSTYDSLLRPTVPSLAPRIGEYALGAEAINGHEWTDRVFGSSPFTPVFDASGLPAMSVPLFYGRSKSFANWNAVRGTGGWGGSSFSSRRPTRTKSAMGSAVARSMGRSKGLYVSCYVSRSFFQSQILPPRFVSGQSSEPQCARVEAKFRCRGLNFLEMSGFNFGFSLVSLS